VIQAGWGDIAVGQGVVDRCYFAGVIPHDWLFKQVAAVVHHGGAGTTAAVWRAGVPAVVVPHAFDQRIWADLTHRLGTGGPPVPIGELTAQALADSLRFALHDISVRDNVRAFSRRIRAEGGVHRARVLIEELMARLHGTAGREPEPVAADLADRRRNFLARRRARRTH
jgi:UDP:flavonoid glycosyltransferase YjiC (YdhE family)